MGNLSLKTANGGINLIPQDGVGEIDLTVHRNGFGKLLQLNHVRSDLMTSFSGTVAGSIITPLNLTITPISLTSVIICQWMISFESQNDTVFRIYKDGVEAADGRNTNSVENRSGYANPGYDVDNASTPRTNMITYIDTPVSVNEAVYGLNYSTSITTTQTLYLNRSVNNTSEICVSMGMIWEVEQNV